MREGVSMSGLALEGISKQFGSFTAVDDVSLAVPHGTFVCLLGPFGCDKTTLLRMIAGLADPSAGQIRLDGDRKSTRLNSVTNAHLAGGLLLDKKHTL